MHYDFKKIEKKWREEWKKSNAYEPDLNAAKHPFYNLMMFPYPSAEGLHVGNMYAFVGSDIYGRYKRMRGHDVFEPIGLDGFGIHSENYAIKIGAHPAELALKNEKRFYDQLNRIGNGFAWNERLETYDPEYYRWTQWLFRQMFERGLAYRKKATVQWCPSCLTVLADEQVLPSGECERCDTAVVQKELEQWFFRITEYAERLLGDIERIDWSENVKIAQRNWIGKSEGALISFEVEHKNKKGNSTVEVFTTRPDTLFGATFLVLAPEHPVAASVSTQEVLRYTEKAKKNAGTERKPEEKEKTGIFSGLYAINPVNEEKIPVWISDYVLMDYGTGALFGDAHDERDFEFAKKYDIPLTPTIITGDKEKDEKILRLEECFTGYGTLVNSGPFTGLASKEAAVQIVEWLTKKGRGNRKITYHLRDWLISRQRYWGPPIPLIFCESCKKTVENEKRKAGDSGLPDKKFSKGEWENPGWFSVPEEDLPVLLPDAENFRPTGTDKSPLAAIEDFVHAACPKCGGAARRETDVSDTFLDSAWYFWGYLMKSGNCLPVEASAQAGKLGFGHPAFAQLTRRWLPVDMYVGGAEHAVLHLLYTRFVTKALYDWGFIVFDEPFKKFRAHGLLIKDGAKMSKSKGNVINPDDYCDAWGVDAIRMFLMFLGPFHQGGDFRDAGIVGIARFLRRTWQFILSGEGKVKTEERQEGQKKFKTAFHQSVKKITEDIERLHYNTAISQLMILLNMFKEHPGGVEDGKKKIFLKLLAPFAPFIAEELWAQFGEPYSIHRAPWPKHDAGSLAEDRLKIAVQINGKVRDVVVVAAGATEETIKNTALASERVRRFLERKKPARIVVVAGRLINIVVE